MKGSVTLDAKGQPYNRLMMVILLLVGTFCTVLNQTILATAFPTLMKVFDVDTSTVQLLTTGFMLVSGILIPVSAWLSSRFNTKWLYLGSMIIFEAGTVMCFAAPTFGILFAGRLVQAVGVGVSMPLLQTILLTVFPPEDRGTAMGMGGIVIGLAPALGPTLSGWILENYSWRILFAVIIPIIAIVIILGLKYMAPVLPVEKSKLDVLSLILSSIGFGAILYGFSSVGNDGWTSPVVIWSLIVGVIFVGLFVWRQLVMKHPFLQLKVFKSFRFTTATIIVSLVWMATIGVEMILPMFLQIVSGMGALASGLTLLPGALLTGIMSPITGRLFDRFGARALATGGLFLLTFGTLPFVFLTKTSPVIYVVLFYAIRMFGGVMVRMPVMTYGMNSLPTAMMGHGTAVSNTVRQIAGSIATAIMVSVLSTVQTNHAPSKSLLHSNPLLFKSLSIDATVKGFMWAFAIAAGIAALAWLLSFFIKKGRAVSYDEEGGEA